MIDRARARGRLHRLHRGVYAVGHLSLSPLAGYMAAVMAVGEGALLSHHSAAALWGLTPEAQGAVDVTVVGRDAGRRRTGICVHRLSVLDPRDADVLHNIPVTSPARALLDITPNLTARELERAFDGGLKTRIVTRPAVAQTAARSPGRPGAARLAALASAELRAPVLTKSETEERLLALVRAGGLPEPLFNARVHGFTVDAFWPRQRLIVEADGYHFHSTRWSFESDHERDLVLGSAGYAVMRFTRDQIVKQPEPVLVRLTRRLTELEAQVGRSSRSVS